MTEFLDLLDERFIVLRSFPERSKPRGGNRRYAQFAPLRGLYAPFVMLRAPDDRVSVEVAYGCFLISVIGMVETPCKRVSNHLWDMSVVR